MPYVSVLIAFMAAGFSAASAQSAGTVEIEADQWVLSPAGGSDTLIDIQTGLPKLINGTSVIGYWNIGEPITETFGSDLDFDASKKRLTQGFEQGEGFIEDPFEPEVSNQDGQELPAVKVFPNPVRNGLHVVLSDDTGLRYRLSLRNLQGVLMYTRQEAKAGGYSLDMTRLSAGIYVLEVETDKGSQSFKIVKVE